MPVMLLRRAFGNDCFDVYYQSYSHQKGEEKEKNQNGKGHHHEPVVERSQSPTTLPDNSASNHHLPPLVLKGGTWEQSKKVPLTDELYIPMQTTSRAKRRYTDHCKESLFEYIQKQDEIEKEQVVTESVKVHQQQI
eukprot:13823658-Ditylum_brightwellii.AAC.1